MLSYKITEQRAGDGQHGNLHTNRRYGVLHCKIGTNEHVRFKLIPMQKFSAQHGKIDEHWGMKQRAMGTGLWSCKMEKIASVHNAMAARHGNLFTSRR